MIERRNRSAPHLFRGIDMKLFVAGVSHKTAPVEVREQLAVTPSHLVDAAEVLKLFGYLDEVVLLSTCNRVEIYGATERASGDIKSLFRRRKRFALTLQSVVARFQSRARRWS